VLRDGRTVTVPAREIVPGDVLVVEAGDLVAADARVLEAHALAANEAPLTGESLPVDKDPTALGADKPLAERSDRLFLGTSIAHRHGPGRGSRPPAWGPSSAGSRACWPRSTTSPTPLQRRLESVGKTLLMLCWGGRAGGGAGPAARRALERGPHRGGVAGRRRRPRGTGRHRHHRPRHRRPAHGQPERAGAQAGGGETLGLRDGDLHGQDRDPDHRGHGGA
jgi:hypothetical protein